MPNRTFRIHGSRGVIERAADVIAERAPVHRSRTRTGADQVPVTEIMTRHVVCALPDLGFGALLDIMIAERLGCVPVLDEADQPIGIVTKLDLVEHFGAPPRKASPLVVADVMMPLALTLDDKTTVAHAVALMAGEDMHHVMIVSKRRLVGVVSTMDVTRWLAQNDELPR